MRKYLGVRYDSRINVFDWDYQMRLAQRDVSSEISVKIMLQIRIWGYDDFPELVGYLFWA